MNRRIFLTTIPTLAVALLTGTAVEPQSPVVPLRVMPSCGDCHECCECRDRRRAQRVDANWSTEGSCSR